MAAPIERKVTASTAAAAVSGIVLWILGRYAFKTGVPDVVASWVYVLVPAAITFTAGYLAKHTSRPAVPPVIMSMSASPATAPPEIGRAHV